MASKEKKKSEKKSAKKVDENLNNSDKSDSHLPTSEDVTKPIEINSVDPATVEEVFIPSEPTPELELNYEEPILAKLVVASFEGEKKKGLYEGEGETHFVNGHYYKGMFSEGYMHGRGLYVWSDGITYEGDFLKNQITGKGKYTWVDGSTYVGDVLNGKRHGFGTFLDSENIKSYTGDWYMGLRHGKGQMDYNAEGKSYYVGDWSHGIKHGWGSRQYPSGNVYNGMWFNNVRHGEGTMRWLDKDQVYAGQWENGIQHGIGQHIWLLRRVHKSQYPLRNMYSGELVSGKRHGEGAFYYANGAKYEGSWKDNMKHGKGKFTFKNGRIYEGIFENDHIVEYPNFTIDGAVSPDLTTIRTRTPIPTENLSFHSNDSRNTVSPSFQLDISTLLSTFPPDINEYEVCQVMFAITRYVSVLHHIYTFYSTLGYQESPDNTFIMSKIQFWIFLKDIHLHHSNYTLTHMDRVIGANYQRPNYELHNPYEKILQRQFVNYLIILAHLIYSADYYEKKETGPLLAYCFSRLMQEKVLCNSCKVKSPIFDDTRRAINILVHMDKAYEIYQAFSTPRNHPPNEKVLKMRRFLLLLKDLDLINEDLTAKAVIQILASNNSAVSDGKGFINLELEMTFLEFFETIIGCAERYVTELVAMDPRTPRPPSTTPESSLVYQSSHQIQSQGILVEEVEASEPNTQPSTPVSLVAKPTRISSEVESRKSGYDVSKAVESVQSIHSVKESQEKISVSPVLSKETDDGAVEIQNAESVFNNQSQKSLKGNLVAYQDLASVSVLEENVSSEKAELSAEVEEPTVVESEILQKEEEAEIVQLDEDTRKFNFWTHQLHIFCVRKFFPRAEKHIAMQKLIDKRMLEEAKIRLVVESESEVSVEKSQEEMSGEELSKVSEDTGDKTNATEH